MRPNIVSEASLSTRVNQWWEGIPFVTSAVMIVCATIYLICLLVGYDSFAEICFLPSVVISHFQVYRIYTSILFHGSLLHVLFNMLALVPLGSDLERIMGSVRLFHIVILLATSNAVFHLVIALILGYNPFVQYLYVMRECSIGFSGVLFSMIVIETSLSGAQSRSVFGLFNVPAKWYPWLLLVVFQLLMTNVSLLGHLCGILSGFAYEYGLFNFLIPGTSFFSAIESSNWLSKCVRRPKFIVSSGGNQTGYMPTHTTSSVSASENLWNNLSSWMPQRNSISQPTQDSRFPGQGRTLAAALRDPVVPSVNSDSSLQTRLLDGVNPHGAAVTAENARQASVNNTAEQGDAPDSQQGVVPSSEDIQKLLSMGFEKTQVEVALAAADGNLEIALEILMSQQG